MQASINAQPPPESDLYQMIRNLILSECKGNPNSSKVWIQQSVSEPEISLIDQCVYSRLLKPSEASDLQFQYDFYYLGSILNYHSMVDQSFLISLKECLPNFVDSAINIIDSSNQWCIEALLKILTLSCFAAKIDNLVFDQEKCTKIAAFFQTKILEMFSIYGSNTYIDLLLRRFLQFLDFTISIDVDIDFGFIFWRRVVDLIFTQDTWNCMFLPLNKYLNKAIKNIKESLEQRNEQEEIEELKKSKVNLKELRKEGKVFIKLILEKQESLCWSSNAFMYIFFSKRKHWTAIYVNFYVEKAIKLVEKFDFDENVLKNYIAEMVNPIKWYMINKKRKNIEYIIRESEISKIFNYPNIIDKCVQEFGTIASYQIQSNSHNLLFLKKYFEKVKQIDTWHNDKSKAEQVIFELLLLTYVDVEFYEAFKDLAVNFVYTLFEHAYNNAFQIYLEGTEKTVKIFTFVFQFLPQSWEKILEFIEVNKVIQPANCEESAKQTFVFCLKRLYENNLASQIPDYFKWFIDHLINYLKNSTVDDLVQMEFLIANNLDGFNLSNFKYSDPEYCAKVLMKICWSTEFMQEKWTEINKKQKYEEIKTETETNPDISLIHQTQISASDSSHAENEEQAPINADNPEKPSIFLAKTDIRLIVDLLEEFRTSYILNMLFENNKFQPQVKNWLLSQLKNLFNLGLKRTPKTVNFMAETNSIVIKLISSPIIKPTEDQLNMFEELTRSKVVAEGFSKINLTFDNLKPYYKKVYFASLPYDIAGVTIFGGDILINLKHYDSGELSKCAQKIVYLHELAHHIRKMGEGFYDISKKTPPPPHEMVVFKGVPGKDKKKRVKNPDEGGAQLETAIFCLFVDAICESQIGFLNTIQSWTLPLNEFKFMLQTLYSKHQNTYQIARCNSKLYSLKRKLHHN